MQILRDMETQPCSTFTFYHHHHYHFHFPQEGVGIMETPNYPLPFPASASCRWRVSPGHTRRVTFFNTLSSYSKKLSSILKILMKLYVFFRFFSSSLVSPFLLIVQHHSPSPGFFVLILIVRQTFWLQRRDWRRGRRHNSSLHMHLHWEADNTHWPGFPPHPFHHFHFLPIIIATFTFCTDWEANNTHLPSNHPTPLSSISLSWNLI